ncbi:hypothetical protein BDV95DRAFT_591978 [Massariosphaeria phaeospora]|uniref:RING-type domain-containing protein n=1 Tax=Massariosphaeria phaeospora TaxID=100035 RepID=A0A7C8IDJ6_9PLEO|nr:hypothetical protein BDV95DRAFT_591978 [Massariosphaeria phaeospora]
MADGERAGAIQLDLEKELTCSICTDLLFQPLTLLDCLHTFCGACLKEWFAFQASTATSAHPYTCPSCRASVRSTQRNATTTTLLDMFLKANPEKGKNKQEMDLARERYKPGDTVLPKLRKRDEPAAEEDRRLMEEVQQLSLRELGIPSDSNNTLEPPRERRRRSRSRERSSHSRNDRDEPRSRTRNTPATSSSRAVVPPRVVEHQSSLRSLLSASELDSQEMEEEIIHQIMEEGLLDGIDLNNIDISQEDEISERIAHAYMRRQTERQREKRERRERLARDGQISAATSSTPQEIRSPLLREEEQPRRRAHGRSESGNSTPQTTPQGSSRPPVSNPALINAANQGPRVPRDHHRRSSSQGSSRSARRADRPAPLSVTSARQANLSQIELGERPNTSGGAPPARRRQSDNQQRTALDERQQFRSDLQAHPSSNPNSPRRPAFNITSSESPSRSTAVVTSPLHSPPDLVSPTAPPNSRRTTDPAHARQPRPATSGTPPTVSAPPFARSTTDPTGVEHLPAETQTAAPIPPPVYPEPQISCNGCGKEHIEYDLHYNCSRCDRGCRHWYGFGWDATRVYERKAPPGGYPPNHEQPHVLVGHRYRRPMTPLTESTTPPHILVSEDDPAYRLESGAFCDICKAFANACYWKCDHCNEGGWGFCNDCVNQGRHCTHPLLPVAHKRKDAATESTEPTPSSNAQLQPQTNSRTDAPSLNLAIPSNDSGPTTPPLTPKTASLIRGPGLTTIANLIFRPLTFTTICNVCTYPVPPSYTRYHCQKCNAGDYDICMSCYHKLVVSNRISKEDGMNGWRRCLRGHRMIIAGFEDRDGGQRRVVVRDLVGGFALRDDENTEVKSPTATPAPRHQPEKWQWRDVDGTVHRYRSPTSTPTAASHTTRFPPDGGVGLRIQALWGYYPDEGDKYELAFPRGAEIREAEDVNGDWFWGVYAGCKGLFPENHVRVVGGREERVGLV